MPTATRAAVSSVVTSDERLRRELRETYLPEMDRSGRVQWRRSDERYIEALADFLANAHYSNQRIAEYGNRSQLDIFKEFMKAYGPRVVQGVLRAHHMSRPYVFFCNVDRVEEAVHILWADAANTGPRGFPLLLDVADQYCSGSFRASEYTAHMNAEFARASGGSAIYYAERSTRD